MSKKQYRYGQCIPESIKIYNRLKKKGHKAFVCQGWVEIDDYELLPERAFLKMFYPKEIKRLSKNYYYNDYPIVAQHTWVEVNGHKIDITRNQFDYCGGIIKYYLQYKYQFKGKKTILSVKNRDLLGVT